MPMDGQLSTHENHLRSTHIAAARRTRKSKKTAGLRALLTQSKSSSNTKQGGSGFGLDLMDLMKTG